jgi:hypothetical protein
MVVKRKTVSKLAAVPKITKASLQEENSEEETDMQMVAVQEEKTELSEKEIAAARTKELKSMGAAEMKQLLERHGLAKGAKDDMIKTLLKHEAKERVAAREHKAKIRNVVIKKKQELEGQSPTELTKLCERIGIKGLRSKEEKVQRLLVHWQENDGVDKALAEAAQQERQTELQSLDSVKLQKLCSKMGVDPFVKEIVVDRLSKHEHDKGYYAKPSLIQDQEASKGEKSCDMVDSLLANETQRKKDRELRSQKEEAMAKRRKELKALSIEDLKKKLTKKGLESTGKKEDMIETLFLALVQEDAVAARQVELKFKSQQELKEMAARYGLEGGAKDGLVKAVLAHEAKIRKDLKDFEAKTDEVADQKKKELEGKTNAALKEMCVSKGLAVGGDKEERIERIVDELQKEGDLDQVVSINLRNKRKQELMATEKPSVVKMCEQVGVNTLVKDIMVERILAHDSEGGPAIALADVEPSAKRARTSKK